MATDQATRLRDAVDDAVRAYFTKAYIMVRGATWGDNREAAPDEWNALQDALDTLIQHRRLLGAVEALERLAPSCGDGHGGWCTDLPQGDQPDGSYIGWCQIHEARDAAQARLAAY